MRFVDTSFWVGLRFRDDRRHEAARALWSTPLGPLVTSNHVLGETWTHLNRRSGHSAAVKFVDRTVSSSSLAIRHIDEAAEADAWDWLRRHHEREYSFVDATSFALMRRLRINEALSFDGDFAAAGFVELRP